MSGLEQQELPISIIIFGASGDLTHRKLVPAIFNQYRKEKIPHELNIVGVSRTPMSHEQFRGEMYSGTLELAKMECEKQEWDDFAGHLWYLPGDAKKNEDYLALDEFLKELESGPSNRLYYLATAPGLFSVIVDELGSSGLARSDEGWRRVVVEKPFGHDLKSAIELNAALHRVFQEDQIYRIDHYLGKETAQNILYFRFLNTIFEPVWNRNYISHVQITVSEEVDVGHRAGYYDQAGVVKDMFQNHLLQLVTLVAMEPPYSFNADAVRNEKVKVLKAVRPIDAMDTVRGQYEGYRDLEDVPSDSQTPTFAAMKLHLDNWRWQGVPFYLRSGKALHTKTSEIVIEFKPPPHVMFPLPEDYPMTPNFLSLCIQPDEGIHLRFETKVPDTQQETRSVDMDFHYRDSFAGKRLPDAYERLLVDAMMGDASLFTRSDEIEEAWRIIDPILQTWDEHPDAPQLQSYPVGSWGPEEADTFIARAGLVWRLGCSEPTQP
jgi:glucose-6-phosphate 1-dehydrogenase